MLTSTGTIRVGKERLVICDRKNILVGTRKEVERRELAIIRTLPCKGSFREVGRWAGWGERVAESGGKGVDTSLNTSEECKKY